MIGSEKSFRGRNAARLLKEEQGLVQSKEGSLADEMDRDAGWPVTQENLQQKPVGGLASSQDFTGVA